MKSLKNTDKILQDGQMAGVVKTPQGNIQILEVVKSGSVTGYVPKVYRYVRLPNGLIFSLTKSMQDHWEKSGFKIQYNR